MPEINIEEKIQEALKKKSFKENKADYLGLSFIFGIILFITFVVGYFLPLLAMLVFIFVDIPLLMGYKHFIWFGPASGETLIDGFKVSLICGYLNFVSYMKIFIATNLKPLLFAIGMMFFSSFVGAYIIQFVLEADMQAIIENLSENASYDQLLEAVLENEAIKNAMTIVVVISLLVSLITFYISKLNRLLLPYVSFLRLTNLEGKSMDGVITHTKRILKTNRFKFYLRSTLCHLLYVVPVGLFSLVYLILSKNPVYSLTTLELISAMAFFATLFVPMLFVELNNRSFCIEANQEYLKEHKKMLNDAINDLDNRNKR